MCAWGSMLTSDCIPQSRIHVFLSACQGKRSPAVAADATQLLYAQQVNLHGQTAPRHGAREDEAQCRSGDAKVQGLARITTEIPRSRRRRTRFGMAAPIAPKFSWLQNPRCCRSAKGVAGQDGRRKG
jgi:hypothetical protein